MMSVDVLQGAKDPDVFTEASTCLSLSFSIDAALSQEARISSIIVLLQKNPLF